MSCERVCVHLLSLGIGAARKWKENMAHPDTKRRGFAWCKDEIFVFCLFICGGAIFNLIITHRGHYIEIILVKYKLKTLEKEFGWHIIGQTLAHSNNFFHFNLTHGPLSPDEWCIPTKKRIGVGQIHTLYARNTNNWVIH